MIAIQNNQDSVESKVVFVSCWRVDESPAWAPVFLKLFFLRMQGVLVDHNDQELNKPAKDMGIMAGFLLGNRSMGVDCFLSLYGQV